MELKVELHPKPKWAILVRYLKIIFFFGKIILASKTRLSEKLETGIKIL